MKPNRQCKAKFLAALRGSGSAALAADEAGLRFADVQALRRTDATFERAWADAVAEAIDRAEAEVYRRAFQGADRAVFYGGQMVGTVKDYSDSLAALYLKAHRPQLYRDRNGAGANAENDAKPERIVIEHDWNRDPTDD